MEGNGSNRVRTNEMEWENYEITDIKMWEEVGENERKRNEKKKDWEEVLFILMGGSEWNRVGRGGKEWGGSMSES